MEMRGEELLLLEFSQERKPTSRGWIQDIGTGGICFVGDEPMTVFALVRCEIVVSDTAVGIPTLMQVRWIQEISTGNGCKIGLKFLI
ncbi:MAG: hypothetical protein AUH86_11575 [Acidobacteria bacterium 13_1_40CM_4_58_4]|nr:MAG: hypothetical protein AUH86_11575 [Acidobacteria bacterium 13_1_40CM_4_58_4]